MSHPYILLSRLGFIFILAQAILTQFATLVRSVGYKNILILKNFDRWKENEIGSDLHSITPIPPQAQNSECGEVFANFEGSFTPLLTLLRLHKAHSRSDDAYPCFCFGSP